ncbi:hypothetical protein C8R45DRAFT_1209901 [Mycena sanguinolenta]|nr:hypothetical protein C8R45DRAFT_1209901 [Mycena sanguinolenta]
MLDKLPPELCALIFDFACRDGRTGLSLSLVSRYIRNTSELARYTTIVLVGHAQILAFARFITEHIHIKLKTRRLFINGQESEEQWESRVFQVNAGARKARQEYTRLAELLLYTDKKLEAAEDKMAWEYAAANSPLGKEGASAVECILRALQLTLEVLDISLNKYVTEMLSNPISLPRLVYLTTRCGFPLCPNKHFPRRPEDVPVLEPTHSLRYLHIVDSLDTSNQWHDVEQFFENGISYFAPSLTHLQLSQLHADAQVIRDLNRALGHSELGTRATRLPPTIELVLLKPTAVHDDECLRCCCCRCFECPELLDLVNHGRHLRDEDHRVTDGEVCDWDIPTSQLDIDPAEEWDD